MNKYRIEFVFFLNLSLKIEIIKRNCRGYAIGGLSGGEDKDDFWRMVTLSTEHLPNDKPRYLMGVGFAIDLVICSALGCDMFDCVFPTRTAVSRHFKKKTREKCLFVCRIAFWLCFG